jgi:hypothetical protein
MRNDELEQSWPEGLVMQRGSPIRNGLLLVLAPLVWCGTLSGFATAAEIKPRQIIAEFEVAPDGDFLRVPLTIGSKEHLFLVNTGLVTTTIDQSLQKQLELPKIQVEVRGKRGSKIRDRFGGLAASLHNIPLEFPGGVETADYTTLNEKLDLGCEGEIGMDVLQRYILQIDFDQGILRFLTALPPSPGEALRITPLGGENGAPTVPAILPGLPPEKFIVGTARGGSSLEIRAELLAQIAEKKQVEIFDKEKGATRSGGHLYDVGRLEAVKVGKFQHAGLIVNSGEQNGIGLSYLARFLVTFDFPRGKMYLQKGAHFDDPDSPLNLWEVGIHRDGDKVAIREVGGYGPAHRLGLRPGDIVESINGCPVARLSNWQVRRLFGREGRPLTAIVRRGSEQLTLQTDAPASAAAADDK